MSLPVFRPQSAPLAFGLAALLTLATSCRSATEVRLDIRTNVPCSNGDSWKGVAVYLGEPGTALEAKSPSLVSTECDASGHVGSLVVAPSGEKDELLGVRVVAGLLRNPEDCAKAAYAGCIVARRSLRFSPHESLALDVELTADCIGQGCDPEHTCLTGGCIGLEGNSAPVDAGSGPTVRCGDDGVRCGTTGSVCCLTVDTAKNLAHGACVLPKDCPPTSVVLNCDDDSDCTSLDTDAGPAECILTYQRDENSNNYYFPDSVSSASCLPATSPLPGMISVGLALCQDRQPCKTANEPCLASAAYPGDAGAVNALPGYFWCRVSR